MTAAKAMRTISSAIRSCSRIMNMAITMTSPETAVPVTCPADVSAMLRVVAGPSVPAIIARIP